MIKFLPAAALDVAQLATYEHISIRIDADRIAVFKGNREAAGGQLLLAGLKEMRVWFISIAVKQLGERADPSGVGDVGQRGAVLRNAEHSRRVGLCDICKGLAV